MIPIQINTKSITNQFDMTKEMVESFIDFCVKDIASSFVRKWEGIAKIKLHSTRDFYISGLKVIDVGRMKGAVLLDYKQHPVIRMIEEGQSAFDIKEGFAKSSKRKPAYRKNASTGWYLTIPFRIGIPTTIGESSVFAVPSMPPAIHKVAKKLDAQKGETSKGLKLSEIPKQFQAPQSRAAISVIENHETYTEYVHKSSIYEGIVKQKNAMTGQNSYMSFRRVSDLSDPMAFIHSGIIAYNLADDAMKELNANMHNELQIATDRALDKLGL